MYITKILLILEFTLQLRLHESVHKEVGINSYEFGRLGDLHHALGLSLLVAPLLFPLGVAQEDDGDGGFG
jgi:hypothetical protein